VLILDIVAKIWLKEGMFRPKGSRDLEKLMGLARKIKCFC